MDSVDDFIDVDDRELINRLTDRIIPCQRGLICRRDGLDSRVCTQENEQGKILCTLIVYVHIIIHYVDQCNVFIAGPCVMARLDDPTLSCDEDGNYETLQCRKDAERQLIICRCVDRTSGSMVPGTEESLADSSDDFPNCDRTGRLIPKEEYIRL